MTGHVRTMKFYKMVEEEFDDPYSEISHYEIKETIGHYQAGLHVDKTFYDNTHKLNIGGSVQIKNGNEIASPITVAEYYQEENEKKREIYLLKSRFLEPFVKDFKKQNLYKKDDNYITQTLKKTG